MKIVLTGGHLSPLLSILESLPKDITPMVIGRKYALEGDNALSLEYQMVNRLGIPFISLTAGRLQRKLTTYTFLSLLKFPCGFFQALSILKKFKPGAVICFGGYVALPVSLASAVLGIPVIIHEQTLGAGLANRIASTFAKKICISFEDSRKFFPSSKTVLTGNFLRSSIINPKIDPSFHLPKEKLPIIYITGGSSGAHAINLLVEGCLQKLLDDFVIVHQAGDSQEFGDFKRLSKLRDSLIEIQKKRYIISKFFETNEVSKILRSADLVVSRAGMNTITELLYVGIPALFIPLSFSQNKEQLKNAFLFKNTGLGEVLEQDAYDPEKFFEKIKFMVVNKEKYEDNKEKARKLVKTDAVQKFLDIIRSEIYADTI